ncbi:TPA: hypothetical protein ACH9R9_004435 [Escherichia coli]
MNKILKLCDWLICSRLMRTPWPLAGLTLCMFIISMLCGWRSFVLMLLSFAGVVLFSYSASLGNVPFRLLPEVRYRAFGRHIIVWSWGVWALGYFCCVFSTLMMMSPVHPVFWLCGGCCGGLLCLQRYLYGGFPWIR